MLNEVKTFLDTMFADSDFAGETRPMTMLECAANIQYWREDGIEVPEGLTSSVLCGYLCSRHEEAKKAEKPVKLYEIRVREVLAASFWVEAHDEDEAETIFDEWSGTPDGCCAVRDRLVDSSEGWEVDGMPCESKWNETPDVAYTEGSALLND